MVDPVVAAAAIAAIPATVAAVGSLGAWRNAFGANRAVNHQGPDEPTLIEHTKSIGEGVKRMQTNLTRVEAQFDEHVRNDTDRFDVLAKGLDELVADTHVRNHDMLSAMSPLAGGFRMIMTRLDQIEAKVEGGAL